MPTDGDFRLGDWLVQPSLNRVSRGREAVPLQPRFVDLLVYLARHQGTVVSKEEILDAVWAKEFVSEGTLTHAVAVIRQTLGDDVRNPRFIETIPTRGYRLIAPVAPVAPNPPAPPAAAAPSGSGRRTRARALAAIAAAAVVAAAWAALRWFGVPPFRSERGSAARIVVMPFQNLGPPARDYVALGMTDDITTRLGSVHGIVVASRTSAAYCAKEGRSARQIAEELGVGYILEGTVRWDESEPEGLSLRVNARLIRARDDSLLWAQGFRTAPGGVAEVGAVVARQTTQELGVPVRGAEESRLAGVPTEDADAYQAYLCGLRYHDLDGREQLGLAVAMFERAAKLDPAFALAYARLAVVHARIYERGIDRTAPRLVRAEEAAARALELSPALPEAHVALGAIQHLGRHDFARALSEYRIAARDLPNDSDLVGLIADVYRRQGKWADARRETTRVVELDPGNYGALLALGDTLARMRQYGDADRAFRRATNVAPDRVDPYVRRFWNQLRWDGDTARAEDVLAEVPVRDSPELIVCQSYLKYLARDFRGAAETLGRAAADPQLGPLGRASRALLECRYLDAAGDRAGAGAACGSVIADGERVALEPGREPWPRLAVARAYAALGRGAEASRVAGEAAAACSTASDASEGPACELRQAEVLARVGEAASATAILRRLLSLPSPISVAWLRLDPEWDPLRGDPAFVALVR